MTKTTLKKLAIFAGCFLAGWLCLRYALPLLLPFVFGALVAAAAEPAVEFGVKKLSLPRPLSVGISVSLTLTLLIGIITLLGSFLVREVKELANNLPDIRDTASQGITLLENWMTDMANRTPEGVRPMVTNTVHNLFDGSPAVVNQTTGGALKVVRNVVSKLPNSALGMGVALISGFLISQRMPVIRQKFRGSASGKLQRTYLPVIRTTRKVVGKWLLAQLKLSGITYGVVTAGFLLLRIPYGPLWALAVAAVDAMPILGTGIILVPWVIISFIQGDQAKALGLLAVYGCATLVRTVMEPKLMGNELGLDPLLTLIFLYVGFRLWGIWGMLLAPVLAAVVKCVSAELYRQNLQK